MEMLMAVGGSSKKSKNIENCPDASVIYKNKTIFFLHPRSRAFYIISQKLKDPR